METGLELGRHLVPYQLVGERVWVRVAGAKNAQ
jgi:hypothetical protein